MFGLKYEYSVLLHDRQLESDPHLGTVIYSLNSLHGPWHPMVTGDKDYCFEIVEALYKIQGPEEDDSDY